MKLEKMSSKGLRYGCACICSAKKKMEVPKPEMSCTRLPGPMKVTKPTSSSLR